MARNSINQSYSDLRQELEEKDTDEMKFSVLALASSLATR